MTEGNKEENIEATGSRTKNIRQPIFTKAELRTMLQHANLRQRSLFLTLISSGLRVGEALQLVLDDIDFNNDLVSVTVRGEYRMDNKQRITFLSREAAESVKEWLKIRGQYLKKVSHSVSNIPKMEKTTKDVEDIRVFPYSWNTSRAMMQKMLRDSGYADKMEYGYRYKYNLHTFRKFFRSNITSMPAGAVAYLMGHTIDPSTKDMHWDTKTLGELYKKAMPVVTIFEPADPTNVQE